MVDVQVPLRDVQTGVALELIYEQLLTLTDRLTSLETTVTELSGATSDLQAAINALAGRLTPLTDTIATLTQTLTDERLADQVEDDDFRAQIAAARDDATAAVAAIRGDIDQVNALAQPATPPEPPASEPAP